MHRGVPQSDSLTCYTFCYYSSVLYDDMRMTQQAREDAICAEQDARPDKRDAQADQNFDKWAALMTTTV